MTAAAKVLVANSTAATMLALFIEPVALDRYTISSVDVLCELKRMGCVPLYSMCGGHHLYLFRYLPVAIPDEKDCSIDGPLGMTHLVNCSDSGVLRASVGYIEGTVESGGRSYRDRHLDGLTLEPEELF